ncbi:MAG TPA: glycosyltransferase family 39 protein [Acidimicrobiales bacterium]|nr:glycosyltransferase family 39 protein [Acidimicrobiales bacterium]
MSVASTDGGLRVGRRAATPEADRDARGAGARQQLGVAGAQWTAGVGNLVFALVAARVLAPGEFAELGAFLSGYVLLHLPAAGIGAGAALSPAGLSQQRRRLGIGGLAIGALLAAASPVLARTFDMPLPVVLALAAAAPGAGLLGLERGSRFGTGGHRRIAAGLVTEPAGRLVIGVVAAVLLGSVGAAVAVTAAGYLSLLVTSGLPGRAAATTSAIAETAVAHPGRTATTITFGLFAVLQQQDLLVAKARLGDDAAGAFAMISTAGGAVAFATATIPLALLPLAGRSRQADRLAVGLTAAIGAAATAVAFAAGQPLLATLFGDGFEAAAAPFPAYVGAMGLLGLGRVLAARRCAAGQHRHVVLATVATVVLHLGLLGMLGTAPGGIVVATLTATATGAAVLALPPAAVARRARRIREALLAWAPARDVGAVAAFTAVAAAVRLVSVRGLWVDEAITVNQAWLPFGEMLDQLRVTDVHPPLHHATVWALVRVLGDAEWVVRLPSVVAGALLVPAAYALGRELYGRRTGLVAALFVTVAPFLVWYSQEARMYALFVLFTTVAFWAQVRAIRHGGRGAWVTWALATAAMLWTQWFGVIPLFAALALFVAAALRRGLPRAERRRILLGAVLASAAVAVLVAPLVPFGLEQLEGYAGRRGGAATTAAPAQAGAAASGIAQGISVYAVGANAIWAVLGYHSDEAMTSLAALWPLLLLVGLGALGRGRSRATSALLLSIALPTVLFLLAGTVKRDLFELRYFAFVVPLLLVLAARTVTRVFPRARTQAVAAGLAALLLVGALVDQQLNGANPRRYDFEGALAEVTAEAGPDDVILYEPDYLGDVVAYYAPGVDARPIAARRSVDDDARTWVVATTRVVDERATAGRVGQALAELEQGGRRVVGRTEVPNVRVWELSR